jgi:Spy/CpxP family protein refolding chaperone
MKMRTALRRLVYMGPGLTLTLPVLSAKIPAAESIPQTAENRQAMHAVNELNLSDDQKGKVKDIFDEAKAKREAILKDTSLTDDQKKEKMKGLRVDTKTKVNEVLTPEQRTQLKEKMEAAKAKQPQ